MSGYHTSIKLQQITTFSKKKTTEKKKNSITLVRRRVFEENTRDLKNIVTKIWQTIVIVYAKVCKKE